MTPTAVDNITAAPLAAIVRPANPGRWTGWKWELVKPDRSFVQAFAAVQKLHAPSSTVWFAEIATAALPSTQDVVTAVFSRLSSLSAATLPEQERPWDVEVDLPVWKGPKGVRVQALVRKVSRGTFPPITDDEIGGL